MMGMKDKDDSTYSLCPWRRKQNKSIEKIFEHII